MTELEIHQHAKRIVNAYLENEIEFDWVYEDDELFEAGEDDQRAVHDEANRLIRGLAV